MNIVRFWRLWWGLRAATVQAQTGAAGARAIVGADTLPVYATMSQAGEPKATLKRGDIVTIGLVLFDADVTWCAISKIGETKRLGFASCEFLERDRSAAPRRPPAVAATPPAPHPIDPPVAPAAVPEPASAPADFVDTVLDGFGLRPAIANYTQTTHLLAFLDKGRLAEIDVPALERVLDKQFQPRPFYTAIGDQLRKSYSPERLPALTEWMRSPVAQKLAGRLRLAYSAESRPELVAFASPLSKTPAPQPRLLLIHRLFDASRLSDMEIERTIAF